ncbi:putative lipid-transfer protein DIR1 [Lotus japonicus]|uniref:Bifunctional inhibitor/plant lipid transfer protein/seed storage helical domain-containing protein n=1 Tax=Lotus japonicus TaxID=34305 RepID=I3SBF7_LOTJA|nr:putative lipid-transfer protein DIR1 [Lotus japonicus]AFK37599.1 unknown [Lotus japonicus]
MLRIMEERKWVTLHLMVVLLMMASTLKVSKGISLCNMNEDGIMACKPSVTKPNPVDPSPECCQALTGADLKCLCSYKNSSELPLLGIDPTLAVSLPAKCNLTPPDDC